MERQASEKVEMRQEWTELRSPLADLSPGCRVCTRRGFSEPRLLNEHLKKCHGKKAKNKMPGIYRVTKKQMRKVTSIASKRAKSPRDRLLKVHAIFSPDTPTENLRPIYRPTVAQIKSTAAVLAMPVEPGGVTAEMAQRTVTLAAARNASIGSLSVQQQQERVREAWSLLPTLLDVASSYPHLSTTSSSEEAAVTPASKHELSIQKPIASEQNSSIVGLAPGLDSEQNSLAAGTSPRPTNPSGLGSGEIEPQTIHHTSDCSLATSFKWADAPAASQSLCICLLSTPTLAPPTSSPEYLSAVWNESSQSSFGCSFESLLNDEHSTDGT